MRVDLPSSTEPAVSKRSKSFFSSRFRYSSIESLRPSTTRLSSLGLFGFDVFSAIRKCYAICVLCFEWIVPMRLLPHAKVRILNRYSKLFQHCIALARMLSELLSEIYWPVVRPAPPLFSLRADVFFRKCNSAHRKCHAFRGRPCLRVRLRRAIQKPWLSLSFWVLRNALYG